VMHGEVARAIAEEVRIKLTPEEQVRFASTHLVNPEAYQAFLKGRYYLNLLEPEDLKRGVELLQRAIDIDPTHAPSYSSMAEGYWRLGFDGAVPPPQAFLKARAVATKALELDGTLGEARAVLGLVRLHFDWDFAGADREYREATELSPSSADVQFSYGSYLTLVGRFNEGIAATKRAAELDPLNPVAVQAPGWACFHARRYDEGIEYLRKQLEIDPNLFLGHYQLAHNYAAKGMYAEALAEAEKAKCGIDCGWVYAVSGRRAEAWKSVQKLEEESRRKYVQPMAIAWVYAGLGEKNHAIRWLQKGYEMRDSHMLFLKVAPELDPLRSDPRFQDLLRSMKFPL
jgi:tetratricopeptide (TPR) repeat protein